MPIGIRGEVPNLEPVKSSETGDAQVGTYSAYVNGHNLKFCEHPDTPAYYFCGKCVTHFTPEDVGSKRIPKCGEGKQAPWQQREEARLRATKQGAPTLKPELGVLSKYVLTLPLSDRTATLILDTIAVLKSWL